MAGPTTINGSQHRPAHGPEAALGNEPELRQLLAGLTAVRDGDFSTKLPDDAHGLLGEIASVFNGMVDQLSHFTSEVTRVAREVGTEGRLGGQAQVPGVSGTWADLTDSVNAMAGNLTWQVRGIAQVTTAVARGDLTQKIEVDARGEILELKNTVNTMVDQLSSFAGEVTRVAREVGTEGILGGQARVVGVSGTWRDLTDSVNSMAGNLTGQVRAIAQVATAVAEGDLSQKITVTARGEILELKETINTMVDQLSSFADEVTRVAREVGTEGRLGGQAKVEGVSGTWKRLTENVNELAGNLTRQVRAIAEVTSAVAAGDLTRSITVDASGEVADLKDNVNFMVESLRETTRANEEQDWLKTNLARFSALMQGRRDLGVVAESVMDELAPLVGAQCGAFYLAEDSPDGTILQLVGSYAFPDGERPTRFRLGESFVGQAARSRRTISVDALPAGYLPASSGLGRTDLLSLMVLPIVVEDQVLGVIELASVKPFTQVHRDFLEQLMETIGVNVNTIIANARTDELLGESQRLTAELQARSEELQARQEELQFSNAELEDKAELLAAQNRDIETKNLEIEQARQELEDRAHQLSLASKYKSEFLANMSHELRTPLNSLLILAQLLAQNPTRNLTAKQVEYAGIIHSAGSDLLQLINDILDLSKVEAGKMDLNVDAVPLRALLDYVEATFRPMTGQKNLAFAVHTASGVPGELLTDDYRLRQVLRNLLSNAVKFTEHGKVELRIEPALEAELPDGVRRGGPVLAFRVTDTGIGIAPQHLETVFGAFQQADGTTSRKYGGTGLGLSISREIAFLLGGAITVESTLGQGTVFTLYLPAEHSEVTAGEPASPPGTPGGTAAGPSPDQPVDPADDASSERPRRLLVVEGRPSGLLTLVAENAVADLARYSAGHRQVEVVTAVGAQEAATALATAPCHCVVLELDLPDGAAAALLADIEGDPALHTVPVLAHNNRGVTGERADSVSRPSGQPLELIASLDELRERIALHMSADRPGGALPPGRGTDRMPSWSPGAEPALAGRTALVVDDDDRNLYAITSILELHGMHVLQAENGRAALESLTAHPGIDVILMDVMMPEMDGYTATAAIRAMPEHEGLPIIAVTAKAMIGDREKSLAAGASDYITKPVDADEVISRITHHLTR
ncbi:GAF sensor hybrid histidine kinase [Streptomyces sp. 1114.5]|uniref:HAMP domain-containing protein n=1 Tax=unclassified Streptomyces TaxID=2593676 RepID=UPI000BD8ABEF|nr:MULTISPECIES: HAMP domain-containing protein [unclassified Streptomyces]RKT08735.1 GAF sensor hybrid histidine kinase [Streptomyces sp. 1114.5]SOB78947.1 GAF sensor hybrid histidine kinase [Streptomyces sp. 1331.2]